MKFKDLNLDEQILKAIEIMGFKEPTQIQRESIPPILDGRDVIGESATGSGKTLAFAAGIIKRCIPKQGIQAIVLVPTRELAEQVKKDIINISKGSNLRATAVYGGVPIQRQINALKESEIVIATPGRFLDHLHRRTVDTRKVRIIVLDEADRMVQMGFIDDVDKIINACPREKQTLLFSATNPEIGKKYMKNPVKVNATKMVDPDKLKQTYYDVPYKLKTELLIHLLKKGGRAMVFCNTRNETDYVVNELRHKGLKAAAIHGGHEQKKRLKTIDRFHKGLFNVLVCTDVAARGLHIEGVTHIYNYDIPQEPKDYVHRIGRTARAGKEGIIINLLSYRDYDNFSRIQATYKDFNIVKMQRPYLKGTKIRERFYNR